MSTTRPIYALASGLETSYHESFERILKEVHGVHGLRMLGETALGTMPSLTFTQSAEGNLSLSYEGAKGEVLEPIQDHESLRRALSTFAIHNLRIPIEEQTSREDYRNLEDYMGDRPNALADPSKWIVNNPLISDLCRRFPQYGNLVRYLCNERGLFLKVGNYSPQRAYWNSTLNGGLPIYRKADPIHEGTFMLHDMFHFVAVDPIIGTGELTPEVRAAYIAHRLLSESSTLVLADMVAIADADLNKEGYDTSKRKIFPIYESIRKAQGGSVDIDKLLAANAYFCFTGDPTGFALMGASPEALVAYRSKYDTIFRDDFAWNLYNLNNMNAERASNTRILEYYQWLEVKAQLPQLSQYDELSSEEGGIDITKMLSLFRADYKDALSYSLPIDDIKRQRLAAQKYLAGQRIVFARFGEQYAPDGYLQVFDEIYDQLSMAVTAADTCNALDAANAIVDDYLSELHKRDYLLPHEHALYRFSAPTYPIRFVNYEQSDKNTHQSLENHIGQFVTVNSKQLKRLLEAAVA